MSRFGFADVRIEEACKPSEHVCDLCEMVCMFVRAHAAIATALFGNITPWLEWCGRGGASKSVHNICIGDTAFVLYVVDGVLFLARTRRARQSMLLCLSCRGARGLFSLCSVELKVPKGPESAEPRGHWKLPVSNSPRDEAVTAHSAPDSVSTHHFGSQPLGLKFGHRLVYASEASKC